MEISTSTFCGYKRIQKMPFIIVNGTTMYNLFLVFRIFGQLGEVGTRWIPDEKKFTISYCSPKGFHKNRFRRHFASFRDIKDAVITLSKRNDALERFLSINYDVGKVDFLEKSLGIHSGTTRLLFEGNGKQLYGKQNQDNFSYDFKTVDNIIEDKLDKTENELEFDIFDFEAITEESMVSKNGEIYYNPRKVAKLIGHKSCSRLVFNSKKSGRLLIRSGNKHLNFISFPPIDSAIKNDNWWQESPLRKEYLKVDKSKRVAFIAEKLGNRIRNLDKYIPIHARYATGVDLSQDVEELSKMSYPQEYKEAMPDVSKFHEHWVALMKDKKEEEIFSLSIFGWKIFKITTHK